MDKLKIIVCVKQVPASTNVKMDHEKGTLIRDGVLSEINPFDMYAVEEAVRLKEKYGAEITAISMGPPQVEDALREVLAMGCDNAILLTDEKFAGADTLATSYTLSCGIKKIGTYDLVICGIKTTDGDTGQVGAGLAEELDIPYIGYVRKIISFEGQTKNLERSLDDHYETVEVSSPFVITVTKDANEPRYPSFKRRRMAKRASISVWTKDDLNSDKKRLGVDGSPTRVIKIFLPTARGKGKLIKGEPNMQAKFLKRKLKEKKLFNRSLA